MDKDIKWFELQLTIVRWRLDAVMSAPMEEARIHIQQAQELHAKICASLVHAKFDEPVQERLERECSELGIRLNAARGI